MKLSIIIILLIIVLAKTKRICNPTVILIYSKHTCNESNKHSTTTGEPRFNKIDNFSENLYFHSLHQFHLFKTITIMKYTEEKSFAFITTILFLNLDTLPKTTSNCYPKKLYQNYQKRII